MAVRINEKFKILWASETRYFIITGGRASGKSYTVNTFLENLTFQKGHKILFTRYTLTSASKSIIPEFTEKIGVLNHSEHFETTNNSIVNNKTGSEILFSGIKTSSGNQTANLKSLHGITAWVLDEAEELVEEDTFDKIDLSVRTTGIQNRVILILNPALRSHWIYQRFFLNEGVDETFTGIKGNVTYIHTTYLDNIENLHPSFIERANQMKAFDYSLYAKVMLGSWGNLEGLMYQTLMRVKDVPEGEPVLYCDSADTGEDYLCSIVAIKTENGLYVTDVVYTQEPNEITERLVAAQIMRNKVNRAIIESNNGGRAFARAVVSILETMNWRKTKIKTFAQTQNKLVRINSNSSTVCLNVYFCENIDKKFMLDLETFSRENPKMNAHDDAPDTVTGLVEHFLVEERKIIVL